MDPDELPTRPDRHATTPGRGKPAWRTWARSLAPVTASDNAAIVDRLAGLSAVREATRVCVFLAMAGEVDLSALSDRLADVVWVTTRTPPDTSDRLLTVHALDAPRERHRFGFPQPVADSPTVDPTQVDTWLVPGLAFDADGNRLGHGAGYYDRLLARAGVAATFIGVTSDARLVAGLPDEPHDQVMDLVVTQTRTIAVVAT